MSLTVLAILVAAGIAGIVLLVHLTGGSRKAAFIDEADARREWASAYPEFEPADIDLAAGRGAALIGLPEAGLGLLWAFGSDATARVMRPGLIRSCVETGTGLKLTLNDFEAPSALIDLTEVEKADWSRRLRPYVMGFEVQPASAAATETTTA
ncbi:MAG: hypothetical protein ACPGID_05265 [Rubricella sp.]